MSAIAKKPGMTICTLAVLAFIAFAGLTAYAVNHLSAEVDSATIANKNGVPAIWSNYDTPGTLSSQTKSEIAGDHIVYTASVTNTDLNSPATITHIASFIDGETKGFLPLDANSLEYSYYPSASSSWTPVAVMSPGESEEDFKLSSEIYLGTGGSSNNTVYFRYSVTPSTSGIVSDKVAFLAKTAGNKVGVAISDNSIAYEPTSSDEAVAVSKPNETTSGEDTFTEPLGVTSEAAIATAIPITAIGAVVISPDIITGSLIVLIVCLGIFAGALTSYLIARKKEEQKNRLF